MIADDVAAAYADRDAALERLGAVLAERDQLAAKLADAEQSLVELKPADVLVEGSWFAVDDLPTILANFMRSSADYAREAKGYLIERDQLSRLHEVATERVIGYAAVLDELAQRCEDSIDARYGTISASWLAEKIASADTDAALRERDRATAERAWNELYVTQFDGAPFEMSNTTGITDPNNPYREGAKSDG